MGGPDGSINGAAVGGRPGVHHRQEAPVGPVPQHRRLRGLLVPSGGVGVLLSVHPAIRNAATIASAIAIAAPGRPCIQLFLPPITAAVIRLQQERMARMQAAQK